MPASSPLAVSSVFAAVFSALYAFGGEPSPEPGPAPADKGPRYRVEVESMVEFLDASPAGPSGDVWRTEAGVPLFFPINDDLRVAGGLSARLADFESSPLDDDGLLLWDLGVFASLTGNIGNQWSVTGSTFVSSSFEDGAGLSDSVNGGAGLAAGKKWSPRLSTSLGALYIHRSFGDSLLVPNIRVDWKISDAVAFSISGLETSLKYSVTEDVTLLTTGEFYPGGGKLKERKSSEARQFEDKAFRFGAGTSWTPGDNLTLTLLAGVAFHEISLRDGEDRELTNEDLDAAPYVSLKATYRF